MLVLTESIIYQPTGKFVLINHPFHINHLNQMFFCTFPQRIIISEQSLTSKSLFYQHSAIVDPNIYIWWNIPETVYKITFFLAAEDNSNYIHKSKHVSNWSAILFVFLNSFYSVTYCWKFNCS